MEAELVELLKPTRRNVRKALGALKARNLDRLDGLLAQNKRRRRRMARWAMAMQLEMDLHP
jgi:hypothetical protein